MAIELLVKIDTWSSKSHIDINLAPTNCLQMLSQPIFTKQMDGTRLRYGNYIRNARISFCAIENAFDEYYPLPQARVNSINHKYKFVLWLNLICSKCSILINSNYISFFKRTAVTLTDLCLSLFPQYQHVQSELHAELRFKEEAYYEFQA